MKGLRLRTLLWKPRQEPLIVLYEQPLAARDHAKPLLLESPTLARQPAWVLRAPCLSVRQYGVMRFLPSASASPVAPAAMRA